MTRRRKMDRRVSLPQTLLLPRSGRWGPCGALLTYRTSTRWVGNVNAHFHFVRWRSGPRFIGRLSLESWLHLRRTSRRVGTAASFSNFSTLQSRQLWYWSCSPFICGPKASTVVHGKALLSDSLTNGLFTSNPVARTLNKFWPIRKHGRTASFTLFTCFLFYRTLSRLCLLSCPCNSLDGHPCAPLGHSAVVGDGICNRVAPEALEAVSKSPVFVSFLANMKGRGTTAYGRVEHVQKRFEELLAANGRAGHVAQRESLGWISPDSITLVVLSCVAVYVLFLTVWGRSIQHNSSATTTQHPVLLVLAIIALRMLIKLTTAP